MGKVKLPLSKREQKVWHYVLGYFSDYAYSPTRQEIADAVGFSDRREATDCVHNMLKKGWVKLNNEKYRNIIDPKTIIKKREQ